MTYDYYDLFDIKGTSAHERARKPDSLPPISGNDDSWWRPGEVLVHVTARDDLAEVLKTVGGSRLTPESRSWRNTKEHRVDPEFTARVAELSQFELYTVDVDTDLPALVEKARQALGRDENALTVNTVFFGEGYYMGGPGAPVTLADEPGEVPPPLSTKSEQPIALTVLDTGMPFDWDHAHYRLQGIVSDADINRQTEMDLLDSDGNGFLDLQAAHGLFICGLANRVAPDIRIDPTLVLHPFGDGDEADIIDGMARAVGPVINMSLGGYGPGKGPTEAMANAVAALLERQKVIVAAAGNDYQHPTKRDLPFWPAAIPGVIAVGAYDSETGGPADFSNRGDWVDVWAPGVNLVSDFVSRWPVQEQGLLEVLAEAFPWLLRRHYQGWARWSGTSFAAPLVAARIAGLVMADPGTPAPDVAQKFLDSLAPVSWPSLTGKLFEPGDFTK